jgi:hypothetical protein
MDFLTNKQVNLISYIIFLVGSLIQQAPDIEANADILSRIHSKPNNKNAMESVISFLQHVKGFERYAVCQSLLRSDVQVRLKNFKTIKFTHDDNQCRIAINEVGNIYGSQLSGFNSE